MGDNEMQERLNAMEDRWTKANSNQRASIDRLLRQRQAVIDTLAAAGVLDINSPFRDKLIALLAGGDISERWEPFNNHRSVTYYRTTPGKREILLYGLLAVITEKDD